MKKIENELRKASSRLIPDDMYERISQNIVPDKERTIVMMTENEKTKRPTHIRRWIAAAVAACLLIGVGIGGGLYYSNNLVTDSIVSIDVNPGIEITTNKEDTVIDVYAINDDAEAVLDGMKLKGVDLKVATNAIIGSLVNKGYITDGENGMLVTVRNDDPARALHTRNLIMSDIHQSLKSNNKNVSIINKTLTPSDDAENFAKNNNISVGKADFVLRLADKDSSLDAKELAAMSIKELASVVRKNKIVISDIVDYDSDGCIWEAIEDAVDDTDDFFAGQTDTAISPQKAKEIALSHADISESDAVFTQAKLETDDGIQVFDIEFVADRTEYEYKINAGNGRVISVDKEQVIGQGTGSRDGSGSGSGYGSGTGSGNAGSGNGTGAGTGNGAGTSDGTGNGNASAITAAVAKGIALNHAGVTAEDAVFIKVECDTDDGVKVFEIDFVVADTEYEYEINADTGEIVDFDSEVDD